MTSPNPAGNTPASVAERATTQGALRLSEITVIGIFGPETALEALVRLPGGAIERVRRGTRLRRGVVAGIDARGLMLRRGTRTDRLSLPGP